MAHQISVDYDDIWNKVSSSEFWGVKPTNEYDFNTIRRLKLLLRQGQSIDPNNLTQEPAALYRAKIRDLENEIIG